jgi:ABC-2 type transport system permease protein
MLKDINLDAASILISLAFLIMITIGSVSIGLILGSQMESPEAYQLVISFVIYPLFFLSGALFPIDHLPAWLAPFTLLDPATYAVDGLRGAMLGTSTFPIALDFAVVTIFSAMAIIVGTYAFKKMKV